MLLARFPLVCLTSALLAAPVLGAAAAHAQSAPATASPSARVDDIQVARDGDAISILIKLSQQPAAAAAKTSGEALTIEIDGLTLTPLSMSPTPGALITRVEATTSKLTLSGAAFSSATTVIYRNAVMIEAKLAEPALHAGASLMTHAMPAKTAPAPVAPPTILPPPAPIAAPAEPAASPDALQSHTAPAALPKQNITSTAALAGITAERCSTAAADLAKDAWALAAMGDHALCLLDAGKLDEAKSRIDQLAAITPQDWRVALGRAVLEEKSGDATKAQAAFVSASLAAPNDTIRAAITERIKPATDIQASNLQLPLPTSAAPAH
ncbi:MAG: tetratricopeptide repeat protein [Hyphomonadaceae bacterium]|nr:tetratricopeptide repeat protein [Hyphomonadaceae bacterium]